MRLWHKDLIPVLPRQQLLGQWRECCALARKIAVDVDPNHPLVNRVTEYPIEHFWAYTRIVHDEMMARGYGCDWYTFGKWCDGMGSFPEKLDVNYDDIFYDWHNNRYFWQCFYNLEEKYDCETFTDEEWEKICDEAVYHEYPSE